MESRKLATLPLFPSCKTRLHTAGYRTVKDISNLDAESLNEDAELKKSDCEKILKIVENCKLCMPRPRTGLHVLARERSSQAIMTFSEKLDTALGGGVKTGVLTELAGLPGVGKTQLCLQLACDVQIPVMFGGLQGEMIYIDTEGGVVIDRVKDIVLATVRHCQFVAKDETDIDIQVAVSALNVEKLLAGVHIFSCYDNAQLLAVVNLLPDMLRKNQEIKLVVIDSVAFHFRHDFEDLSLRTRILTNLAQTLIRIAREFDIAVVGTNQMTTRVHQGSDKGSHLIPYLGDSWGHACSTRIILQLECDIRLAWLYKSPSQSPTEVCFEITVDGIRDLKKTVRKQIPTSKAGSPAENHKRQKLS